ncbi:MAG: DUF4258 domain-containing protein [Armatimonadota bacterium]|nr:DUF4258 domain-containing protein [Armatimonadota bacterium]
MCAEFDPLIAIKSLVQAGHYRIRSHAVRHMIEEGFDENNLIEVVQGKLRLVDEYSEESRYLVTGYFYFTPQSRSPLHLVCDLSNPDVVDIVTAYIPQRPWWNSPTQRGERR